MDWAIIAVHAIFLCLYYSPSLFLLCRLGEVHIPNNWCQSLELEEVLAYWIFWMALIKEELMKRLSVGGVIEGVIQYLK